MKYLLISISIIILFVYLLSISDDNYVDINEQKKSVVQTKLQISNDFESPKKKITVNKVATKPNEIINKNVNSLVPVYVLQKENHKQLLNNTKDIRDFIKNKSYKDQSSDNYYKLSQWLFNLYNDALMVIILEKEIDENLRDDLRLELQSKVDTMKIINISEPMGLLSESYLMRLNELVSWVNNKTNSEPVSNIKIHNMALEILDMSQRRKRVSDNYFKSEMKSVFMEASISLDEKLDYFNDFIDNSDWTMVLFGKSYFDELSNNPSLTLEEQFQIDFVLEKLPQRKE